MRRGVKLGIGIPVVLLGIPVTITGLAMLVFVGVDGTFTTPTTSVSTPTHAVVISASLVDEDLREGGLGGEFTLDVRSRGDRIFVGVAGSALVAKYLDGVAVAEADELTYPGGDLELRRIDGAERPTPPDEESFWTASAVGDGELTWELEEGDWSVVIMNADGSPGVDVVGTATTHIPVLGTAIVVLLVIGIPMLVLGMVLIVSAIRHGGGDARGAPGTAGIVPPRPDAA